MSLKGKLDKVDKDIENGKRFKAANRLQNMIKESPNQIELWHKLAELYYEGGFLDAAGKYWILTEPTEDRIKKCVEIYESSVNNSGCQILREMLFHGDVSQLSPYAQNKIAELESDCNGKMTFGSKFKGIKPSKANKYSQKQKFQAIFDSIMIFAFVAVVLISLIVGLLTIINYLFI
jgi:hypothetical protein